MSMVTRTFSYLSKKLEKVSFIINSEHFESEMIFDIFTENIKVRFYESDEYENVLWEDWGRFSEADVHHQFAIALKTPPYREMNIDKNVSEICKALETHFRTKLTPFVHFFR